MKKAFIYCILLVLPMMVHGQQDAAYSMYMFNGLYLNPAYAGSKETATVAAIYRQQWAGFEGAPRTASVGIHSPLMQNQYALGLQFSNDRLGHTKMNSVNASFAYRIRLKKEIKIALGIQAGFTHYNPDLLSADLPDPTTNGGGDIAFSVNQNLLMPNFGFGIYTYSKRFYIGISLPHMLNNSLVEKLELEGNSDVARQYRHVLASAGVVIGKETARVKFVPSTLFKFVNGAPADFDFTTSFLFVDRFWLGASYRIGGDADNRRGESIIGMFEMKVTGKLEIGYAYDYTLSAIQQFTSGTHEIYMGFDFGFDKAKYLSPRYINYF